MCARPPGPARPQPRWAPDVTFIRKMVAQIKAAPEATPYGLNAATYGGCDGRVHVLWRTYTTGAGHAPTGMISRA